MGAARAVGGATAGDEEILSERLPRGRPAPAGVDVVRLGDHVRAAAAGDAVAFRAFVELTTPVVYRLCLRILREAADAEDATQETFVRAWTHLERLRDERAALAWVCRIARYVATDKARARGRRRHTPLDAGGAPGGGDEGRALIEKLAAQQGSPHELLESAQARALVLAFIDELKDKHRVVLLLRDIDGLSYEEIASALDVPVGTVESRLHRARAALKSRIQAAASPRGWKWW